MGKEKVAGISAIIIGSIIALIGVIIHFLREDSNEPRRFKILISLLAIGILVATIGLTLVSPVMGGMSIGLSVCVICAVIAGYTLKKTETGEAYIDPQLAPYFIGGSVLGFIGFAIILGLLLFFR